MTWCSYYNCRNAGKCEKTWLFFYLKLAHLAQTYINIHYQSKKYTVKLNYKIYKVIIFDLQNYILCKVKNDWRFAENLHVCKKKKHLTWSYHKIVTCKINISHLPNMQNTSARIEGISSRNSYIKDLQSVPE